MKSTGIIRKIDELGRVVLPIELRRNLDISVKDAVEIYVEEDMVILKKYESCCTFCGKIGDLITFNERNICTDCANKITNALKQVKA